MTHRLAVFLVIDDTEDGALLQVEELLADTAPPGDAWDYGLLNNNKHSTYHEEAPSVIDLKKETETANKWIEDLFKAYVKSIFDSWWLVKKYMARFDLPAHLEKDSKTLVAEVDSNIYNNLSFHLNNIGYSNSDVCLFEKKYDFDYDFSYAAPVRDREHLNDILICPLGKEHSLFLVFVDLHT